MDLKNCTAIITGGASGMGLATARLLHQHHVKLALLDLNQETLSKATEELSCMSVKCDVTNAADVEKALSSIQTSLGPIRIAISCAGVVHGRRMVNKEGTMPLDEFARVININLIGTFNVMRVAAAAMMQNEPVGDSAERGVIINTASVAAYEGQIGQTAYSASKGGIVGLTLPAARELASSGIRVMTIAPGLVDTPLFAKISDEARASLAASVPFPKRLARPEEFALLAKHIIENSMLNGEVIRLDGALRMSPK